MVEKLSERVRDNYPDFIYEGFKALEAENQSLMELYEETYDELQKALNAIINHEEVKYTQEELAKCYMAITDVEFRLSKAQELVEKWRSTEKIHDGVRCHAWKVCTDELEEALK